MDDTGLEELAESLATLRTEVDWRNKIHSCEQVLLHPLTRPCDMTPSLQANKGRRVALECVADSAFRVALITLKRNHVGEGSGG